ncbi:MAG: hypothetical protein ED559_08300 [Phycisphaera sp.]|nr:MAG: hypothetical protein ED559_08300 [Phycisphaera sp.]
MEQAAPDCGISYLDSRIGSDKQSRGAFGRKEVAVLRQNVHYPHREKVLLFLASMDVMLTHTILNLGGVEANPLAARVFEQGGTFGMSIYKFALLTLFVVILEYIGSKHFESGRKLASAGIAISLFPVVVGLMTLPWVVCIAMQS